MKVVVTDLGHPDTDKLWIVHCSTKMNEKTAIEIAVAI